MTRDNDIARDGQGATDDLIALAEITEEARARWRFATPYRKGIVAGQRGYSVANPYPEGSKSANQFDEGIKNGRARASQSGVV